LASRLSDEELACRCLADDPERFTELVDRYRDRVYRLAYRFAGNTEDAEDWCQEAFLRAFMMLDRYQPGRPFSPWLLRVATNYYLTQLRGRQRRLAERTVPLIEERLSEDSALVVDSAEGTAMSEENHRLALEAVHALPPVLKAPLLLRFLEGMSFREIGQQLGIPLQTAATRVRRALERTQKALRMAGVEP
jgi:RNA polymerase sigma-70 factor (ECF subfamily)